MQQVNQFLSGAQQALENTCLTIAIPAGQTDSAKRSEFRESDAEFVNKLFKTLEGIFPAWRNAFADKAAEFEAKRQWSLGMIDAGLTNTDAIKAGLALARKSKNPFIPSVGQFIGWCQEAAKTRIGFPSIESTLIQILDFSRTRGSQYQTEIHPVAYWIYQHVDLYALRHADTRESKKILEAPYHEAEEKAAAGYEFPLPPKLLPDDVDTRPQPTPEQVAERDAARAKIKSLFGSQA